MRASRTVALGLVLLGLLALSVAMFAHADPDAERDEFVPVRRAAIRGVVIDRDTFLPIAGARVEEVDGASEVATDERGEFVLQPAPSDHEWSRIGIKAAGYCRSVRHCDANRETFLLRRAADIRGIVLAADGQPIVGTKVHLSFEGLRALDSEFRRTGPVDAQGRFEFKGLPSNVAITLDAHIAGRSVGIRITDIILEGGESREVVLRERTHVELTGIVRCADGRAARGGEVRVSIAGFEDAATIRTDGTYYFPFACAGSGWLEARSTVESEGSDHAACVPIEIAEDQTELTVDVALEPACFIAGRFVGADGSAVRYQEIELRGVAHSRFTNVDASGAFRFDRVLAGEYDVQAVDFSGTIRSAAQRVRAGTLDVVLRGFGSGKLTGRVVGSVRSSPRGSTIRVSCEGRGAVEAVTADDGTYVIAAHACAATVQASNRDRSSAVVRVEVQPNSQTRVPDLVLREYAASLCLVSGRVAARATFEVWDGSVLCAEETSEDGDATIAVPVGSMRVLVRTEGQPAEEHRVDARAGVTTIVPVMRNR